MKKSAGEVALQWLRRDLSQLSTAEQNVVQSSVSRTALSRDTSQAYVGDQSFGDRVADTIARVGGSWTFISLFGAFLFGWAILNTDILGEKAFDPYPYVFLNLVLSMLAAIQAPIIMMSQNRQAARDRMTMIRDFEVNLKSELAIKELHGRMDHLTWQLLSDLDKLKRAADNAAPGGATEPLAGRAGTQQ